MHRECAIAEWSKFDGESELELVISGQLGENLGAFSAPVWVLCEVPRLLHLASDTLPDSRVFWFDIEQSTQNLSRLSKGSNILLKIWVDWVRARILYSKYEY